MEKDIEALYQEFKKNLKLSELQLNLLHYICEKAVLENPDLDMVSWRYAIRVYLNLVARNPQIDLGPIVRPS